MGKIIKIDQYRRHRQQVRKFTQRHRMRRGFQYAEAALKQMIDQSRQHPDLDEPAIWYALARGSIQALRLKGWSREDLVRLIEERE